MIVFKEARHLEVLKCFYNEAMDVFVFHCAGKKITIQYASPEQIATIFRKAQVKDEHPDSPRSHREKTYLEMVAAVIDGSDQTNHIWSSEIGNFFNACEDIRQSRIGKVPPAPITEATSLLQEKARYIVATINWSNGKTQENIFDQSFNDVDIKVGTDMLIGITKGKVTKTRLPTAQEITLFRKQCGEI